MPVDLAALASRADTQLSALERSKMQEFLRALRTSHDALQSEFVRRWPEGEDLTQGGAIGRARADIILQQTGGLIELVNNRLNGLAEGIASSSINDAWQQGIDGALEALRAYDPNTYQSGLAALGVQGSLDTRSMMQAMQGMQSNLTRWTSDFIVGAQDAVIQSLVSGAHTSTLSSAMAEKFATTRYNVDRVLRTELHQAQDRARREMYKEANVQYVQRVATQDERVCFWCAERAGNVYVIDEAPASLHPFDRCFNMPWNPIWEELGLTDDEWVQEHARETRMAYDRQVQERRAAGYTVRVPEPGSRAPFDKIKPPKPVWEPEEGYTRYGKRYMKKNPPYMPPRDDEGGTPPEPEPTPPPPSPPPTPESSPSPPPPPPPPEPEPEVPIPSAEPSVPEEAPSPSSFEPRYAEEIYEDFESKYSYKKLKEQLTEEELRAVQAYTSQAGQMNGLLRGTGTVTPEVQQNTDRLNELLASGKMVAPEDMIVYRGTTVSASMLEGDLMGHVFSDPGFASTTLSTDVAEQFLNTSVNQLQEGRIPAMLEIRVPKGSPGIYMEGVTTAFGEAEWLMPAGTKFRVVGSARLPNGQVRLVVELEQPTAGIPRAAAPAVSDEQLRRAAEETARQEAERKAAEDAERRRIEAERREIEEAERRVAEEAAKREAEQRAATEAERRRAAEEAERQRKEAEQRKAAEDTSEYNTSVSRVVSGLDSRLQEDSDKAVLAHYLVLADNPKATAYDLRESPITKAILSTSSMEEAEALFDQYRSQSGISNLLSATELNREVDRFLEPAIAFLSDPSNTTLEIRAPTGAAMKIMSQGRFKSQFETGTSRGTLGRAGAEEDMFGYTDRLSNKKRPVYGYLNASQNSPGYDPEEVQQNLSEFKLYGEVMFVLKEDVRSRTTFTLGDSLFGSTAGEGYVIPSALNSPSSASFHRPQALHGILNNQTVDSPQDLWDILNFGMVSEGRSNPRFVEAQYHGGLSMKDVSHIVIDHWDSRTRDGKKVIEAAKKAGLRIFAMQPGTGILMEL